MPTDVHEPVMVRPYTPYTPVRTEWLVLRQFREGDDDALLLFDSDRDSPRRLEEGADGCTGRLERAEAPLRSNPSGQGRPSGTREVD